MEAHAHTWHDRPGEHPQPLFRGQKGLFASPEAAIADNSQRLRCACLVVEEKTQQRKDVASLLQGLECLWC